MNEECTALSILIHGDSKTGKTWLADTAPGPRLVLDAEGGNRFTPSKKIYWDPVADGPPVDDGTWDTCIVRVRDYTTMQRAFAWLNTGTHPFRSIIIDSISEVQQRCVDQIAGTDPMKTQDWGELLRHMSSLVRQYRDLIMHPTNPVCTVILIAMTIDREGKHVPFVQGKLQVTLPYYIDVIGYLYKQRMEDGTEVRRMLVAPHEQFEAGDRTGRFGQVIDNPNITQMIDTLNTNQ